MAQTEKKSSPGLATLVAGGFMLLGELFYAWKTGATSEFRDVGFIWSMMTALAVAVILVPICSFIAYLVESFNKRDRLPRWLNSRYILALGALLFAMELARGGYSGSAKGLYSQHIGIADNRVSEVEVVGFNSFLSSRWLFAFSITVEDASHIVSELGLEEDQSIDLNASIAKDVFFMNSSSVAELKVPSSGRVKSYYRTDTRGQSITWFTLIVDEDNNRAWLYKGYQS